jgi:methylsterol monooxygenase
MKSHIATAALWVSIVIVTTLNDHAGFHFPFLHSSELHDYHHFKFNANYSVYGFMDVLHNTFGSFAQSENFKHHQTLFTLKSVRELDEK